MKRWIAALAIIPLLLGAGTISANEAHHPGKQAKGKSAAKAVAKKPATKPVQKKKQ